jgi:dolichyl-phosphate beta-glucosyltransferase
MESKPSLSIVIPAYNEAERIGPTLESITAHLNSPGPEHEKIPGYEIIVVSDGSSDATEDIVRGFAASDPHIRLIEYHPNRGKGYAVRIGMIEAAADDVLFSDADLATPIEDLEKLRRAAQQGFDVVVGSRVLEDSIVKGWRPWYRELSGMVFNLLIRLIAMPGIRDTQCGFKYFTKGSGKRIFSMAKLDGFGFDVEALFLARKFGLKVKEVGVSWENSPATKVSLFRHTLPMIVEVSSVRINDWKKVYEE